MTERAPLAIDLYCGLGGWTSGLLAEGYRVIGYDIEAHEYDGERYPAELVLQDVLELHGSAFKDAALIVASPPCQEYSYMAMPWSRAKAKAAAIRADTTGEKLRQLNQLFDACFRIQREASEAAGHKIPMVVENVRGATPWVGRAQWNFGSYYLWGDVPALMPKTQTLGTKHGGDCFSDPTYWGKQGGATKNPGFRFDGSGRSFQSESVARHVEGQKAPGGVHIRDGAPHTPHHTNVAEGRKAPSGTQWFNDGPRTPESMASMGSKSLARKAASAKIAKIPLALSRHIAAVYRPRAEVA